MSIRKERKEPNISLNEIDEKRIRKKILQEQFNKSYQDKLTEEARSKSNFIAVS